MKELNKNAIFVVDGSYLLYRSYYAIRPLKTSSGISTQATFGFCRAIKKLLDDFNPENIIIAWDSKEKTFRTEIYPEYKATRQAPPSDLFIQKEQIFNFLDLIKLKQIAKPGYEADDIIYSITQDFKEQEIIIVGPDKDLYQLLSKNILIFDPFKNELIDQEKYKELNSFEPEKVSFYYSLLGDSSDNIPGVSGIGKKTALELVTEFKTLEDLYENINKVKKERTKELLLKNKDNAFLSFKLFSLKYINLDLNIKDFIFNKNNWNNAGIFFKELEFTSLLKDIKQINKEQNKQPNQLSIFDYNKTENNQNIFKLKENFKIINTKKDFESFLELLKDKKEFAIDTETTGLSPFKDNLVGLSFALDNNIGYYIPVGHKKDLNTEQLDINYILENLKDIFSDNKIKKILHNSKFDQLVLHKYNLEINNIIFDTLVAASLLKKDDFEKINLKALSVKYLKENMIAFEDILSIDKYKSFDQVPIIPAANYSASDALQTFKLKNIIEKELEKTENLLNLYNNLEHPFIQILFKMESIGIKLDPEKLKLIGKEISKDLKVTQDKIESFLEHEKLGSINLNSPQQVEELLFDKLKLPVIKKSAKGQRSTDQEVLQELSKIHPVANLLLNYRVLNKLLSTYVDTLIEQINPKTGRIHTNFSQTMAATGRLASSEPNLQNIPVSSDHGLTIRSAFIAADNNLFLSADYSQIELRVLAHLSQDENLIKAFKLDKDIHAQTATQIFDIQEDKVTHEQRQLGKKINFSIIYGLTPYGLAKDLDIKPSQAKEYIDKYFSTYSGVANWINNTEEFAKKHGYTQTLMGRKRYVPNINEKNHNLYQAAKRIAINSPVQGTAAELLKMAMLSIDKIFTEKKLQSKIILQIHDELLIELPQEELNLVENIVREQMENIIKWTVPLKVTLRSGNNWQKVTK